MSKVLAGDVLGHAPRARRRVVLGSLLLFSVTLTQLARSLLAALVIEALLTDEIPGWANLLAALGGVALLGSGIAYLAESNAEHAVWDASSALRARALEKLLRLGPGYTAGQRTGELQVLLVDGVNAAATYVARFVPTLLSGIVGPVLVVGAFLVIDWPTGSILLVLVVLSPLLTVAWLAWRMPKSGWIFTEIGRFNAQLLDGIQGLATLKANNASGRFRSTLAVASNRLRELSMRSLRISLLRDGISTVLALGGIGALVVFNAWRFQRGSASAFALLATLLAAREALRPIERLEGAFHAGWAGNDALGKLRALFDAPAGVVEVARQVAEPDGAEVAFDAVSFTYPGAEVASLQEVSFRLRPGETLALVGPSGAGKSTIVALLQRFFDPDSGTITLGGIDARDLTFAQLRAQIAVVSQETYLFPGTIEDNIRLGRPEATRAEVIAAARAALAHEFVSALPRGYDTEVGERGDLLSGGQKQRLAIARALLVNAPILVLDEPTSNLDPANERDVLVALENLPRDRAALVISHSPSLVQRADRVAVLDMGRVVEERTPADRVRRSGEEATR